MITETIAQDAFLPRLTEAEKQGYGLAMAQFAARMMARLDKVRNDRKNSDETVVRPSKEKSRN